MDRRLPHMESPLLVSIPLVLIQLRCVDLPVKTGLDPPRMTARVQETLIAVTIASVAVHTNATISESLIATPLHTERDPVLGSRILPDIWTSPASPLRLTIRHRENVSRLMCHSRDDPPPGGHRRLGVPSRLLRGASPHGRPSRLLRGASPHGGPLRLLRGASPHGGPRRLLRDVLPHGGPRLLLRGASPTQRSVASKGSPPPKRMAVAPGAGPSSARRPLSRDSRSPRRSSRESLSPKRGSPSPKRRRYEARDSVSPPHLHSSRASSREPSQERPHSRSSPTRPASPSREEKEADEIPIPATVKAMVDS